MMKVTIESKMKQQVSKAIAIYDTNITSYLDKVANQLKNQIMYRMNKTPRDGRIYKRKGGKAHQSSSKNNPPAPDSATLINSFRTTKATKTIKFASVFTSIKYAGILEKSFSEGGLQRTFMGKKSVAYKETVKYANAKYKDIAVNRVRI